MLRPSLMLLIVLLLCVGRVVASEQNISQEADRTITQMVQSLTQPDADRAAIVRRLRSIGPAAMHALAVKKQKLEQSASAGVQLEVIHQAMDYVSGQRYGHVSGLYWYTDYQQARRASQEMDKPILSLRMLGNLTDEYSCANSRFFRVILYADPKVSEFMRENFILHWQAVRDVPQVTVTLADGRSMRRTVTGNSAHLVINPQGQVVDIIPGLYHPDAFLQELEAGVQLAAIRGKAIDAAGFSPFNPTGDVHRQRREAMRASLATQLATLGLTPSDLQDQQLVQSHEAKEKAYRAEVVMNRAFSKRVMEAPLVEPIVLVNVQQMWRRMNDANWRKFVDAHDVNTVQLSDATLELIRLENGDDIQAMIVALKRSLLADTLFNQHIMHDEIHRWFSAGVEGRQNPEWVTTQLYQQVLGMDLQDPWAGLHDASVYTGLDKGGMSAHVLHTQARAADRLR